MPAMAQVFVALLTPPHAGCPRSRLWDRGSHQPQCCHPERSQPSRLPVSACQRGLRLLFAAASVKRAPQLPRRRCPIFSAVRKGRCEKMSISFADNYAPAAHNGNQSLGESSVLRIAVSEMLPVYFVGQAPGLYRKGPPLPPYPVVTI